MNEISILVKRTPRAPSPLLPCEGTIRCLRPGRGSSLGHADTLILDLQAPEL